MKIAVILPTDSGVIGGGYSFIQTVLTAVARVEMRSQHDFYYFIQGKWEFPSDNVDPRRMMYFPPEPGKLARFGTRLAERIRNRLIRDLSRTSAGGQQSWLMRKIKELGIEIVWFTGPFYNEVDAPFVFTHWDLQHLIQPWFPEVSRGGQWEARQKMYSRFVTRATRVIAPNEAGKRELVSNLAIPSERVIILPHPTPDFALEDRTDEEALKRFSELAIRGPYLFYPAQFWPHKNHVGALRVLKALREKTGERVSLVFSGADMGNLGYVRRKAAELKVADQVYFVGFVELQVLRVLYQKAACLLYLSWLGPENLPPLEAFGLGCPVVAAKVDGAVEQLGDAALLVEPGNIEQIVAAVGRILHDPALVQQLTARGRVRAQRWTSIDYVHGLVRFFDEFQAVRECWE